MGDQKYQVRRQEGRLADVPYDVRVYFSKRHPREKSPAYIACTDLTCSAKQALQGYAGRWSCEVVNFYLKVQLGLADFRVRSYEAVDKYIVVVHLAWAYVEAANFAVRHSPELRAWYQRKAAKTKRVVAIKAVANKLAKACFFLLRDGVEFDVKRLVG